ncbi:MAG: DUF58 domain-containing protein [Nitrospirae bacterium]|nr:DUF58 domain-containing protein [Nitrospirota bacterium]
MPKHKKPKKPFRLSIGSRSLTFTPLGWRFILISLGVGLAAVNSGSNLLYLVVAMMLSMVLISGVLSEQAISGLRVTRRLPDAVYALTPVQVRYTVVNRKKLMPSFGLAVSDYWPGGPDGASRPGAYILKLGPGEEGSAAASVVAPARGRWSITGTEVTTSFPFGLFRKTQRVAREEVKLVYPHIRELGGDELEPLAGGLGEEPAPRRGQGGGLHGLRGYQRTDDARHIHWKRSAGRDTLMVKEFEAEETRAVRVVFDNHAPERPAPDYETRFEEAVTRAASVVHHLLTDRDVPVSFVSRDAYIPPGSGQAQYRLVMETLAGITPVKDTGPDMLSLQTDDAQTLMIAVDSGTGPATVDASAGRSAGRTGGRPGLAPEAKP